MPGNSKKSTDRPRLARRETAQRFKNETAILKSTYRLQEAAGAERQILQMLRLAERQYLPRPELSKSSDDLLVLAPVATLPSDVEEVAAKQAATLTQVFSKELLRYLQQNPTVVFSLPGGVFEELIAELLASLGFEEISLRVRTEAGEADILGFSRDILGHRVGYIFELKQRGSSGNLVELRE